MSIILQTPSSIPEVDSYRTPVGRIPSTLDCRSLMRISFRWRRCSSLRTLASRIWMVSSLDRTSCTFSSICILGTYSAGTRDADPLLPGPSLATGGNLCWVSGPDLAAGCVPVCFLAGWFFLGVGSIKQIYRLHLYLNFRAKYNSFKCFAEQQWDCFSLMQYDSVPQCWSQWPGWMYGCCFR